MGGSTRTQTTTNELDPAVRPYVQYGLSEAQRLYQTETPQYYPGQTFVGPSAQTQQGLTALQNRAIYGSPLLPGAQQQALSTIQGQYLGGNPFFQGAFQPAAQAAQTAFYDAMRNIGSQASRAGRYGSGAMGQLQDRASGQLAQTLANTAGQLAFQNYESERARQQAMIGGAPALAAADYGDIQQLMGAGQTAEAYQQAALQSDINRFNFLQGLPQSQLNQYLGAVYGAPRGAVQTTPVYTNRAAGALGGALAGGQMFGPVGAIGGGLLGLLGG